MCWPFVAKDCLKTQISKGTNNCYLSTNSLVDAIGTRSCYIKNRATKLDQTEPTTFSKFSTLTRSFLDLFMFHRRYSNCRPQNSARYNRIICQTVENMSFLERLRLSCILHAFAKGYQGHKSNFGFHVPFDREIRQISDQKSVFGFA